jgi:hypothetical protein
LANITVNPRVFPPVAWVESRQLIEVIDASTVPDRAGVNGTAEPFVAMQLPQAAPVFGFRNPEHFPDQ